MALNVHPTVKSSVNWASYATLGLYVVNSITPDMLAGLGKWEPLAVGAVVIASTVLGAVTKKTDTAAADQAEAPAGIDPAELQRLLESIGEKLQQPAPEPKTVPVTVTPQP